MNKPQATRNVRNMLISLDICIIITVAILWRLGLFTTLATSEFSGERAYEDVVAQCDFGPRITGSAASLAAGQYISDQLKESGWEVEFQPFTYRDTPVRNIIGRANVGQGPIILLGAHYDSRRRADRDPDHLNDPVPGANDGASGAAVLLELSRSLDLRKIPHEIWLAFFDAEDNGGLDGWEWIVGSTYMADHLAPQSMPQAMILVDMIGDEDQQFFFDSNSNADLETRVWATAARLGYGAQFTPIARWAMLDDHIPFARRGIPSIDIIDFEYGPNNRYWHTTADTADKVSAASLERIGRTLEAFLESPPATPGD